MALFLNKWGDIRGSVSDLTFSSNAGGAYIRSKVTPINPQSARQQQARALLAAYASEYSTLLTDEQRQGWIDLASRTPYSNIFGDKRYLNGIAMYCKVNCLLASLSLTTLTDAPDNLAVRPLVVSVNTIPTVASRTWQVSITPTLSATETLMLTTTAGVPSAINFVKNLYRFSDSADGVLPNPIDLSINPDIGNIIIGQRIHSLFARVDHLTGGVTLGVPVVATVVA